MLNQAKCDSAGGKSIMLDRAKLSWITLFQVNQTKQLKLVRPRQIKLYQGRQSQTK